jgi:hypothetical protein
VLLAWPWTKCATNANTIVTRHRRGSDLVLIGSDDHPTGVVSHLVLGGRPGFAINCIDYVPEKADVTGHRPVDDMPGDPIDVPLVFVEPGPEGEHQRSAVGFPHDEPPLS